MRRGYGYRKQVEMLAETLRRINLAKNIGDNMKSIDATPSQVRSRLNKAGCPIDTRKQDAAERAMKGLEDGLMVVSDKELTKSHLSLQTILRDERLVAGISKSDHIAYGMSFTQESKIRVIEADSTHVELAKQLGGNLVEITPIEKGGGYTNLFKGKTAGKPRIVLDETYLLLNPNK